MADLKKLKDISQKVKQKIESIAKPGKSYLELAEEVESYINELGAKPAFPLNISVNEVAAHYTPSSDDVSVIGENDLLKVDFGIFLEGQISDNALTLDFSGNHGKMVDVAQKALEEALSSIKPGVTIKEVSARIEKTIKEGGFKPIANLTGHKIEGEFLHAGVSLPNVSVNDNYVFKEGDVFAVEPFITTPEGKGMVVDTDHVEIYSFIADISPRIREARIILNEVKEKYGHLPFAERWIEPKVKSRLLLVASLKELLSKHAIQAYPVLREANSQLVAQAEKTVIITHDGVEPLI